MLLRQNQGGINIGVISLISLDFYHALLSVLNLLHHVCCKLMGQNIMSIIYAAQHQLMNSTPQQAGGNAYTWAVFMEGCPVCRCPALCQLWQPENHQSLSTSVDTLQS